MKLHTNDIMGCINVNCCITYKYPIILFIPEPRLSTSAPKQSCVYVVIIEQTCVYVVIIEQTCVYVVIIEQTCVCVVIIEQTCVCVLYR